MKKLPLRLSITILIYWLFSFASAAQSLSPTPKSNDVEVRSIQSNVPTAPKERLILVTEVVGGATLLAGVFVVIRARNGILSYHVNQFRVFFMVTNVHVSAAQLSTKLEREFEEVFKKNPIATAKVDPDDMKGLIQFIPKKLAKIGRAITGYWDYVELVPRVRDNVFHVHTLLWDVTRSKQVQGLNPEEIAKLPSYEDAKTVKANRSWIQTTFGIRFFKQHFLAGTRSWCIHEALGCDQYEEPHPSGKPLFLETAALEKSSHISYKGVTRGAIETTWQCFLRDALNVLDVSSVSCQQTDHQGRFRLGPPYKPGAFRRTVSRVKKMLRKGKANENDPHTSSDWRAVLISDKIQIWQREAQFNQSQLKSLANGYGERLFELHPGIREEYFNSFESSD
jgi:hypothetical protein